MRPSDGRAARQQGLGGDHFACVVPGPVEGGGGAASGAAGGAGGAGGERTETCLVLTPKVSMTGAPKLEPQARGRARRRCWFHTPVQ